jgi:hypothetical protein
MDLQKGISGRSSVMSAVNDKLKAGMAGLVDVNKNLHNSFIANGNRINVNDIQSAIRKLEADTSLGMKGLLHLDSGTGQIRFASKDIIRIPTSGLLDTETSTKLIEKLSSEIGSYTADVSARSGEILTELTEGLMKRATALEAAQHEIQALSGVAPRGRMLGTGMSPVQAAGSGERLMEKVDHGANGASRMPGMLIGAGIGGAAGYMMGSDDNKAVATTAGAVGGGILGYIVHGFMNAKNHVGAMLHGAEARPLLSKLGQAVEHARY